MLFTFADLPGNNFIPTYRSIWRTMYEVETQTLTKWQAVRISSQSIQDLFLASYLRQVRLRLAWLRIEQMQQKTAKYGRIQWPGWRMRKVSNASFSRLERPLLIHVTGLAPSDSVVKEESIKLPTMITNSSAYFKISSKQNSEVDLCQHLLLCSVCGKRKTSFQ